MLGQRAGEQAHTLTISELPTHTHSATASSIASDTFVPTSNYLGMANNFYAPLGSNSTTLPPATLTNSGGSQPHDNMQPFLCVSFIISLFGIFPSQT